MCCDSVFAQSLAQLVDGFGPVHVHCCHLPLIFPSCPNLLHNLSSPQQQCEKMWTYHHPFLASCKSRKTSILIMCGIPLATFHLELIISDRKLRREYNTQRCESFADVVRIGWRWLWTKNSSKLRFFSAIFNHVLPHYSFVDGIRTNRSKQSIYDLAFSNPGTQDSVIHQ